MTRTIRITMRPDQPVEVTDQEFQDLTRMGVVLPETAEEVTSSGQEEPEDHGVEAPGPEDV